jgi:hypothetical protein
VWGQGSNAQLLPEEEIPAFLHRAEQAVGEPIKDLAPLSA